jgi:protein TonB
MGHQLLAGALIPPRSRATAAVPVSMGVHVAVVGALLAVPLVTRGDPPPPPVRAPALDRIVLAPPAVTLAPSLPVAPRPGPRLTRRAPERTAAVTPPTLSVPLAPDPPPLTDVADDGEACVGCTLTTGLGSPGDGAPGTGDGAGGSEADGTGSGPYLVGPQVSPPAKLRHVDPEYPELAKRAGVQGKVVIECLIDRDGSVARARVVQGAPLLDAAALAAVQRWRYRPTLVNGVAVPVLMTVTVHFHLK